MSRKAQASAVMILAVVWLPAVLFINPGWLSLLLVTPYFWLFVLAPLVLGFTNKAYSEKTIPNDAFYSQIIFYVSWFLLGIFFVNGGDTEDSVQSIFSRILNGLLPKETLIQISGYAYAACIMLIVVTFFLTIYLAAKYAIKQRKP